MLVLGLCIVFDALKYYMQYYGKSSFSFSKYLISGSFLFTLRQAFSANIIVIEWQASFISILFMNFDYYFISCALWTIIEESQNN